MKDRKEFEEELSHVAQCYSRDNPGAYDEYRFARNRLLEWFDSNARRLGENGALRESLALAVKGKVEAEIQVLELEQRLEHALRTRKEDEDAS